MNKYISIIVPVYNVEKYLNKCINSLVLQDYPMEKYEIILVDDGSTDQSGIICDKFSTKYDNVYSLHKKNGGLSDARNYGLEYAKGEYIIFVDSDDYIENNSLSRIVKNCKKQGEPDVFFLKAKKLFSNGYIASYDTDMDISFYRNGKKNAISYIASRKMFPASAWSKMVKRDLLIKNNIWFKVGQLSEDYEWSLLLFLFAEKFGADNNDYYYYRQKRQGSITSKCSERHFCDLLGIIKEFESKALDYPKYKQDILSLAAYIYRTLLWNAYDFYSKYKEDIKRFNYLLKYRTTKEIQIIRRVISILGVKNTIVLLEVYRKVKK